MAGSGREEYLGGLLEHVGGGGGAGAGGGGALALHPRGMEYVTARLRTLDRLRALRGRGGGEGGLDYLRAYAADVKQYQRLETLQGYLWRVERLTVASQQPGLRDPTPLDLSAFRALRHLEVRDADLSSAAPRGLGPLRASLESLSVHNSAEAAGHVLGAAVGDESWVAGEGRDTAGRPAAGGEGGGGGGGRDRRSGIWERLVQVSFRGNQLCALDASLELIPAVRVLDLSRNQFTGPGAGFLPPPPGPTAVATPLQPLGAALGALQVLDLSSNRVAGLGELCTGLAECRMLRRLVLADNAITSTEGLEVLAGLESLDLSGNLLGHLAEARRLAQLPWLGELWLRDNPLCEGGRSAYRASILGIFRERATGSAFELDGAPGSPSEIALACGSGGGGALARGLRLLPKSLRPTKPGVLAAEDPTPAETAVAAVAGAGRPAAEVRDAGASAPVARREWGSGPARESPYAAPSDDVRASGAVSLLAKHALESTSSMLLASGGAAAPPPGGAPARLGQELSRPVSILGAGPDPAPENSPPRYHPEVLQRAQALNWGTPAPPASGGEAWTDSDGSSSPWPSSDEEEGSDDSRAGVGGAASLGTS